LQLREKRRPQEFSVNFFAQTFVSVLAHEIVTNADALKFANIQFNLLNTEGRQKTVLNRNQLFFLGKIESDIALKLIISNELNQIERNLVVGSDELVNFFLAEAFVNKVSLEHFFAEKKFLEIFFCEIGFALQHQLIFLELNCVYSFAIYSEVSQEMEDDEFDFFKNLPILPAVFGDHLQFFVVVKKVNGTTSDKFGQFGLNLFLSENKEKTNDKFAQIETGQANCLFEFNFDCFSLVDSEEICFPELGDVLS
jgi:hypothetical protein